MCTLNMFLWINKKNVYLAGLKDTTHPLAKSAFAGGWVKILTIFYVNYWNHNTGHVEKVKLFKNFQVLFG